MTEPLHENNPTGRFSDRAADYVKYRPGYPPEAIDAVLEGLNPSRGGTLRPPRTAELFAADVGAGTGISARLLAERGVNVFAIEPNAEMRQTGEQVCVSNKDRPTNSRHRGDGLSSSRHLGGGLSSPRTDDATSGLESPPSSHRLEGGCVTWHHGTAEATGLADASVDLVLCAQSYHWFEPVAACLEFGRVLRPGGRLALMWNDADERDPVAKGYYDLVRAASEGGGPTSHQTVAREPRVEPPFAMSAMRRLRFRHEHRLDAEGLVGRAMSASYVPRTGEQAERLVEGLRRLHAEHVGADGRVGLVYGVWVYVFEQSQAT